MSNNTDGNRGGNAASSSAQEDMHQKIQDARASCTTNGQTATCSQLSAWKNHLIASKLREN